jgi:hypothetical protein
MYCRARSNSSFVELAGTRTAKLDELLRAERRARREMTTLDQKQPERDCSEIGLMRTRRVPPPWSVEERPFFLRVCTFAEKSAGGKVGRENFGPP